MAKVMCPYCDTEGSVFFIQNEVDTVTLFSECPSCTRVIIGHHRQPMGFQSRMDMKNLIILGKEGSTDELTKAIETANKARVS